MIYIQSNIKKTRPHHFDCSTAMFGAIETEMDYKLTTIEDVKSGKWDSLIRRNLFVGSVEFNDMWAIGNYGIPNDMYLKSLKDRYFEIIKST